MKSLLDSRKFWIALVGILCVTAVVIVSLFLRVPEASMLTVSAAIGGLAYKLIDGIAREDAAKATPPPMAQSAGTIINTSQSTPPPPADAAERTPTEALRSASWPTP